jgi:hypothetical protein
MIGEPNYSELTEYVKCCEEERLPVWDQHCLERYVLRRIHPHLVIAVARVLFVPQFFVYKGCTFRVLATVDKFPDPNDALAKQKVIEYYEHCKRIYHARLTDKGDPEEALRRVEAKINWYGTHPIEMFAWESYGIEFGEENHRFLGECIAAAWRGALLTQFPDEKFVVEVWWDGPGANEWELTFYHASPHPGLKWWLEE